MQELVDAQILQQTLHISQRTRNHMEKKGLPVTGSGQAKRYHLGDVQAWIQTQRKGIESLVIGNAYNNDEITTTFQCSSQGGMRRSHTTNTLVLLSNHTTDIYEDRSIVNEAGEEMLLYTGMGTTGDQDLHASQNKTLYESNENGVPVYLFETFEPRQHIFRGQVTLAETPYQERQKDRKVWIFPLRFLHHNYVLPETMIQHKQDFKEQQARSLDMETLQKRAKNAEPPSERLVQTKSFDRNPYVTAYVKQRAEGICENCHQPAPFISRKDQTPYLEVHHKVPLSEGGLDTIEKAIAICPNCHQAAHYAMEVTTVVAGILFEDNQVLIAQRAGNDKLNGKWEFPGGKLQERETNEQGLRRELQEELGIETNMHTFLGENMHQSSSKTYRLMAYIGERIAGTYQQYVHQDLQWVDIKNLDHYDFLEADRLLIDKLKAYVDSPK